MKIDNIETIKPLLKFTSEDDYYFLQVLTRKKDDPKTSGSNNSSRLVRAYNIGSIEYLDKVYSEIKGLCEYFGARAMICLNKRSYRSSSHQMMVQLAQSLQAGNHKNSKMWNSVSGRYNPIKDKTWIIDLDGEEASSQNILKIAQFIKEQQPYGHKIVEKIPSKSGMHLITKPFDLRGFERFGVDVHKNNPTNLYIP